MSGSMSWCAARESLRPAVRSAAEGLVLVAAAALALPRLLDGAAAPWALAGVVLAWILSTASLAACSWARRVSFKAFVWAFGAGAALRAAALAGLVLGLGKRGAEAQGSAALAYILAVTLLVVAERRHLRS